MKIAYIYDCIYPYIKGGAEKRYYEISQRLKDKHEIHMFGMKFWEGQDVFQKDNVHYHGVCKSKKLYVNNRRSIWQPIYFSIKLIPALFREKFDMIDCSAFPYFSVFSVWLYSKIKKVPVMITWHEYWGNYWYKYLGKLGFFGLLIEKLTLLFSPKIISVSETTKNKLIKTGVKSEKIITIPNGIDFKKINMVSENSKSSDIIFSGRLIKEKNIDVLLKSVDILRIKHFSLKCYIIGQGPEKEKMIKLKDEMHLEKNVEFIDFLEKENDLYAYLKSSKVFILPSVREGFGIIALEANACGLPVITVNHPDNATQDLIRESHNGFLTKLDPEDISQKIDQLLSEPKLYKRLRENSINFARSYDWEKILENLENYYKKI